MIASRFPTRVKESKLKSRLARHRQIKLNVLAQVRRRPVLGGFASRRLQTDGKAR